MFINVKIMNIKNIYACFLIAIIFLLPGVSAAERIRDLASIQGVRNNQLIGYGLVIGLKGTGDSGAQVSG